jgi:hypothetical protein
MASRHGQPGPILAARSYTSYRTPSPFDHPRQPAFFQGPRDVAEDEVALDPMSLAARRWPSAAAVRQPGGARVARVLDGDGVPGAGVEVGVGLPGWGVETG